MPTDLDVDALLPALAIVTVTYNPDIDVLAAQAAQLPAAAMRIIVDNASRTELASGIAAIAAANGAVLLENDDNLGLAAAQNRGIRAALANPCRYVLLLDQDTEPGPGGVQALLAGLVAMEARDASPACVGPRLVDARTGLDHGFHVIRGWRWARVHPPVDAGPVDCVNLNASGSLMSAKALAASGGMDEAFFIDHVDTEWAFRARDAGVRLLGLPGVTFRHRMGDRSWRFWWFGWRVWPYRSAQRHRYLFRNAARLMRRRYVPVVWKAWACPKLVLTFVVHLLFDRARWAQAHAMLQGIRDARVREHDGDRRGDA